jgi:hypothetical protein
VGCYIGKKSYYFGNKKMNYSNGYFGKALEEVEYIDLVNFFIEVREESDKIEFKSYPSTFTGNDNFKEREKGVFRTICAFLNSSGGLIIWGAPVGENVANKKEKVFTGELTSIDKLIEKDSFINRVTDSITPSPHSIKFKRIEHQNRYFYILEVEESPYSPHQYRDVYYMRIDGQTKPAPHHYIEALFRKVKFPNLEGYIRIDSLVVNGNYYFLHFSNLLFNKSKLQNEYNVNYRIVISLGKFGPGGSPKVYSAQDMRFLNAKDVLYFNEPLINSELIELNPHEVARANHEIEINYFFGGKNSPLKCSMYKLSLKNSYPENPNDLIETMQENIFLFEHSDKIDKTDEEKMKLILNRR